MNSFTELLKYAGLPNTLILVVAVIFAFNRIRPITMVTSTFVEGSLQTKEKRLYSKIIRNIGYLFIVLIFQMIILLNSIFFPINHYREFVIVISVLTILGLIFAVLIRWGKEWFRGFWQELSIPLRSIILLFFVISILSTVFMFPFIIGSNVSIKESTDNVYRDLITFLTVLVVISLISLSLFKWQIKSIDTALSNPKSIFVKEDEKEWYVFYPVDDKYFLCGNQSNKEESTVFKYFDRTKLLEKELHVFEKKSEQKDAIEYII
ncbi:hypothetical protein [Paenibacillus apis]|uniref:Uncharacterized protein n=1 Tax=Paenibacillus apis TaxID=1792174 RepID=A0A920CM62_9BACL|nr:hypothetical protein [Paenibacillus apis]GIO42283.1 hypothetical protein J41TS4_20410 [Paenibacillus apis]